MKFISILIIIAIVIIFFIILGKKTSSHSRRDSTEEDILNALTKGNKIEAIKHYRSVHSVGLKEAKEAVERMQDDL